MSTLKHPRYRSRTCRSGRPAFTLLELIVVLLVLGILAAIAVPTFNRVKQNAVSRVAQTTLEVLDRNGEAIAFSDPDMTDEQIAATAVSEVSPPEGVTITRAGAQITVQNVSGSMLAEGSVTFSDGVGTIDPAVTDPEGASGGSSSSSSTTVASSPSTTASPSTTTTVALQSPAAPSVVSVLRGDLSLVLNWTSSPTASSPITEFEVYLDGVLVEAGVSAAATSYTFPGLLDGVSYVLGVRAVNTVGGSLVSESSPTEALSTPPAPADLVAVPTAAASTRLDLSWSPVTSVVVAGYNVYRFNPSTSLYETVGLTSSSSFSDTGLTAGVTYDYKVSAYNAFAEGALSDAVSATPISVPLAPTGVAASQDEGASTVTWSWGTGNEYPGSDDRPITGVTLKACTDQGMTENCLTETPTSGALAASSYPWTGLVNGTTYYFQVIASNAVGSVASDPSSPVTPYQPPTTAPTLTVTACTDNSTPACAGGQTLKLSWTAVTATAAQPVAGYEVYRLNPTSGLYEVISVPSAATLTYTDSGLVNGTARSYKVAAYNATATGAQSSVGTATPYTVPGSPTNVSATASNTSATFTFSAPSSDGGSAVTGYTVTCANTSGGSAATATGSTSPLVVTLVTGQSYTCTMTAANAAGAGTASGAVTLTATYTSQGNYTCPSGGSLSGSTCTQTYAYYTYSCMPGGTLSGSTCYAPYGSEAYGPGVGCNTHYGWYDYGGGCASAPYTHGPHYSYSSYSATWVDTSYWSRTVT